MGMALQVAVAVEGARTAVEAGVPEGAVERRLDWDSVGRVGIVAVVAGWVDMIPVLDTVVQIPIIYMHNASSPTNLKEFVSTIMMGRCILDNG